MKPTKFLLILLTCIAAMPVASVFAAGSPGDAPCFANCVVTTQSGNRLLFVAKDRRGQIFATANVLLPARARLINSVNAGGAGSTERLHVTQQSGLPVGTTCHGVSGICTEHSSLTYETPSHYIVVSITYVFFNGDLQDIDVDETRISKNKFK